MFHKFADPEIRQIKKSIKQDYKLLKALSKRFNDSSQEQLEMFERAVTQLVLQIKQKEYQRDVLLGL